MIRGRRPKAVLLALGLLTTALPSVAQTSAPAQMGSPAATNDGWTVTLVPYLWLAGITGTITTPLGSSSGSANFGNVLSNLTAIPIMGAAEVRKDRFGLMADFIYLSVKSDVSTPGPLFGDGKAKVTSAIGTALGTYRVVDTPKQVLDVGAGVRVYGLSTDLSVTPGILQQAASRSFSTSWADPLLAARYQARLGGGFGANFYGDVGGFGAGSEITWQLMGSLSYAVSDSIDIGLGYRHLAIDYKPTKRTELDLGISGPFLSARFRF